MREHPGIHGAGGWQQGGPPGVPANAPPPQPPARKSRKGLIIGGCVGCLLVLACCCGSGGYLLYLEEGRSYGDPGEEWKSHPLAEGQPIRLTETWQGTGYATLRVYVDAGESAPPHTRVEGIFDCVEYGEPVPAPVSETQQTFGDVPPGWIQMPNVWLYVRDGGSFTCEGALTVSPPSPQARLVITKRQRPSDWLSGL